MQMMIAMSRLARPLASLLRSLKFLLTAVEWPEFKCFKDPTEAAWSVELRRGKRRQVDVVENVVITQ